MNTAALSSEECNDVTTSGSEESEESEEFDELITVCKAVLKEEATFTPALVLHTFMSGEPLPTIDRMNDFVRSHLLQFPMVCQ